MDQYYQLVWKKSTQNEADLRSLVKDLSKREADEHLKAQPVASLENCLGSLAPNVHTIGYMHILNERLRKRENTEHAIQLALTFLQSFDPNQARLWPTKFAEMCQTFTDLLVELKEPIRGVAPLLKALDVYRPTPRHITPLHATFVQLCLLSKCYHMARPVLDQPITEVSVQSTGIDVEGVLKYYYYGGMAYTGLKLFTQAQDFYLAAVSVPAQAASAIALEAYKKYVLVSLLAEGNLPKLPSYTPSVVTRQVKTTCKPYTKLADAYHAHNMTTLRKVIQEEAETFVRDNTLGLANQCVDSLFRRNIQRLTRTFMTLSLANIAEHVGLESPQEAERYILKMIGAGQIHAKINQRDGMVSFMESPEQYNSSAVLTTIDDQIRQTITINEKIAAVDAAMSKMEAYLQKVIKTEKPPSYALGVEVDSYDSDTLVRL